MNRWMDKCYSPCSLCGSNSVPFLKIPTLPVTFWPLPAGHCPSQCAIMKTWQLASTPYPSHGSQPPPLPLMSSLKASSLISPGIVSPIPKALFLRGPFKRPSQPQPTGASQKNLDPSFPSSRPNSSTFLGCHMPILQAHFWWLPGRLLWTMFCSLLLTS